MDTEAKSAVQSAGKDSQYDENAKKILAQKHFLAWIMVKTVDEFKGMKPIDVVPLIEGEPKVGIVPVDPGMTNEKKEDGQQIVGLNTENSENNEGLIRFDIVFYVRMRDGLTQVIVNVEAQKKKPTKYKLLNRAVFYVSRLISSQKSRDFVKSNYNDMRPVFSIWICMNMAENTLDHIHLHNDHLLGNSNWDGGLDLVNIVMIGVSNDLPEHDEKYELHRLLGALFSKKLSYDEKLEIIENEFAIPLNDEDREEVKTMCNLSEGIRDDTLAEVIMNMHRKDYTVKEISEVVEKTQEEVEDIIEGRDPILA